MWPFNRLRRRKQVSGFTLTTGQGQAQWSGRNYGVFSEEGYKKNIIAYRCITLRARSVASVPWVVFEGDDELSAEHPLRKLLDKPNPTQGRSELFEALASFYLITGNTYLRAIGPDVGPPRELWTLRPDRTEVSTDDDGHVNAYKYTVKSKTKTFPVDKDGDSEVLHIHTFNPLNDYYGLSPMEAAAFSIDQHNAAGEWNYKLLKNNARPSGALSYEPADATMPLELSEAQRQRLKRELTESFSGPANAGRPLLLEGGLKWQQIALSPVDMDFLNSKNTSARDVAQAYSMPPMLVGIVGDATFANYKEARLASWEDATIPDLVTIRGALNRWLAPKFGPNIRLEFNTDEVPALVSKRQDMWDKIEAVSFLKINEKREAIGYEEVEGGDVILINAMQVPLGEESENEAEKLPPKEAAEVGYGK